MPPPPLLLPTSASAQREQFAKAYAVLERAIAEQAFPGASFGVLAGGRVLALDGVGGFTYDQATERISASTVYDLASLTKVIATTAMAMLLHQNGSLPLDRTLASILPAFSQGEAPGSVRQQVTLRLLLTHASGLPGYVRLFEGGSNSWMPASAFPSNTLREVAPSTPIRDSSCWAGRSRSLPARDWNASARVRYSLLSP
jgi:CubicO group peptidase (beta-lactamase class C family)